MWRDVATVKRLFKDMQVSVQSEISRMQKNICSTSRDVANACSGVSVNLRKSSDTAEQQSERLNSDLRLQMATLIAHNEQIKAELSDRDQRLQSMLIDLKSLEDRCMQAENQALQVNRLNDEIERLNVAMRDIAHVVVQDAEVCIEVEPAAQHLHLSKVQHHGSGNAPLRSPKRGGVRTSQAFAEGTISAVQASLHKYQLLLHDMQVI